MTAPGTTIFSLRQLDWDRYVANLFLPGVHRGDVDTLFAFSAHIATLSHRIAEPAMGEIRLRWWIDAVAAATTEDLQSSPMGDTLSGVISRHGLSAQPLVALLEAHQFDFYNDLFPTIHDFESYAGETASMPLRLAAQILDPSSAGEIADLCGHAGVATAIHRHLRTLPQTTRQRRLAIPVDLLAASGTTAEQFFVDKPGTAVRGAVETFAEQGLSHLRKARDLLAGAPPPIRPLFLTLVLLEAQLGQYLSPTRYLDDSGELKPTDLGRLSKLWRVWREARRS